MAHDPHHVVPVRMYLMIFGLLMVFTAITTAVAFVDLGALNNVIMLSIAVTKATLVVLYFMHVRYSGHVVWLLAGSGFVWLAIMILITMSDVMTRAAAGL
jgi:cytochrome c oxidase subunit IV